MFVPLGVPVVVVGAGDAGAELGRGGGAAAEASEGKGEGAGGGGAVLIGVGGAEEVVIGGAGGGALGPKSDDRNELPGAELEKDRLAGRGRTEALALDREALAAARLRASIRLLDIEWFG